jgi:hypothetical protein
MQKTYHQHAAALLQDRQAVNDALRLMVNGRSMAPLLRPGDVLVVQPGKAGDLLPGQIVVLQDADGFLTHRLIAIGSDTFVTKGDAMPCFDPPAPFSALVGWVQSVERDGNTWLNFSQRRWRCVWPCLALLYKIENQVAMSMILSPRPKIGLLKDMAGAVCWLLRGVAFLLQWIWRGFR